jgi:hypothetical protein
MRNTSIFILVLLVFSCNTNKKEIFPLLPFHNGEQRGKQGKNIIIEYYCIKNFNLNKIEDRKKVDTFIFKRIEEIELDTIDYFKIIFYKYGDKINENYQHDEDNQIAWQSDEKLIEYDWINGQFAYLFYYLPSGESKTKFKSFTIGELTP